MVASKYRALVETSSRLADVDVFDDIDHDTIVDATALLERIRPVLDSVRAMELHECVVPVDYKPDFFPHHMDDVQHLRNLSRALRFASDVAAYNEDYRSVARFGTVILDLANAVRRGGLVVDHLVSIAVSGCGVACLRKVRERFSDDVRRDLIDSLDRYEREREPFSCVVKRDAEWEAESGYEDDGTELSEEELIDADSELPIENQKLLIQLVKELSNQPKSEKRAMHADQERRALAITRLLAVDLAIRCSHARTERFPNAIAELVPDCLPRLLRDPFSNSDFIYRHGTNSFTLYSTGPDKTDSGGHFGPWIAVSVGGYDLCLDSEDYSPNCCTIQRPSLASWIWSRLCF